MRVNLERSQREKDVIKIDNYCLQQVNEMKYFGVIIQQSGAREIKINLRIDMTYGWIP